MLASFEVSTSAVEANGPLAFETEQQISQTLEVSSSLLQISDACFDPETSRSMTFITWKPPLQLQEVILQKNNIKEIVGESYQKAHQFLAATNWQVDEAIDLFYTTLYSGISVEEVYSGISSDHYNASFCWNEDSSAGEENRDELAGLFRPPIELICKGNFEQTKVVGCSRDKWVILNVQSIQEFSSHELNRDTWGHEAVQETIRTNFLSWQITDDREEGKKVCCYYGLTKLPSALVIDPITGRKMKEWKGMIDADRLMEDLLPYMDSSPLTLLRKPKYPSLPQKPQEPQHPYLPHEPLYPSLPQESHYPSLPQESHYPSLPQEPELQAHNVCRIGIRLPDGKRIQTRFFCTNSIELLWSFCSSQVEEAAQGRQFKFKMGHATTVLHYSDNNLSFGDAGISNSLLSLVWE